MKWNVSFLIIRYSTCCLVSRKQSSSWNVSCKSSEHSVCCVSSVEKYSWYLSFFFLHRVPYSQTHKISECFRICFQFVKSFLVYFVLGTSWGVQTFQRCVIRCLHRTQSHTPITPIPIISCPRLYSVAQPEIANPQRFAAWLWNKRRVYGYRFTVAFEIFPDDGFIEGKPIKAFVLNVCSEKHPYRLIWRILMRSGITISWILSEKICLYL